MNHPMSSHRLRTRILLGTLVIAAPMAFAAPASALAANPLYAGPNGTGTACTAQAPCDLRTAINHSPSGGIVDLIATQGVYNFAGNITTSAGNPVQLQGSGGRARLVFSSGTLQIYAGGATNLSVQGTSSSTVVQLRAGAVGDRLVVANTSTGHACYLDTATLTNTLCWAGPNADIAAETDGSNTLRNDTLVGGSDAALVMYGRSSCGCANATDTLVNVIARGTSPGNDLNVISQNGVSANVALTYSNYNTSTTSGGTISEDGTVQHSAPLFTNAGAGNFREAGGSPTIGAGVVDAANGTKDLDGRPRVVQGKTDIGAYQQQPPVISPVTLPASTAGVHYSRALTAAGGSAPYTFSVASGALPAGLSLSSGGVLSGTPTTAGTNTATIHATDAHGFVGTRQYTLRVVPGLSGPSAVARKHKATLTGTAGPGQNVKLFFTRLGQSRGLVTHTTADASTGHFTFTPVITATGRFDVTANGQRSKSHLIATNPTLSAPAHVQPGHQVTLKGEVGPRSKVTLYRGTPGHPLTRLAAKRASSTGQYVFTITLQSPVTTFQTSASGLRSKTVTVRSP